MNAIERLQQYRANKDRYLPLIDHETQYFPDRTEFDDVNIGWNCDFIGNRPYFLECWATSGITMITIFISTIGIEDYTLKDMENLLINEGKVYSKLPGYIPPEIGQFTDSSGNEFYSVNIVAGEEDEPAQIDGARICSFNLLNAFNGFDPEGNIDESGFDDLAGEKLDDVDCDPYDNKFETSDYDFGRTTIKMDNDEIEEEKSRNMYTINDYKFCLKERKDGSAMLFTQDLTDIFPEDDLTTISVYRFDTDNWSKMKRILNVDDPIYKFFRMFYSVTHIESWFERKIFEEFCEANGIEYSYTRDSGFWFQPEEGLVGELLEFLEGYEDKKRYRIPDRFPDPNWKDVIKGYWPLEVDMRNRTVREVHGITVCAAYCTQNVLMKFTDMKGFYL
ncbi:MAG: hypothetical protein J5522_09615 [Lachnospiraceae bacterium]|nr:hypothetical protein [Lachnospiraceae bacterium]